MKEKPFTRNHESNSAPSDSKSQNLLDISDSNKFHMLIDAMPDGYSETDLYGNLTLCNKVFADFHGQSRDDLIGSSYKSYIMPEDGSKIFNIYNEVYNTGNPKFIDALEIIKKDGSNGFIEAKIFLIRSNAGKPAGFGTIARDITEEKTKEQALVQTEENYEKLMELAPDTIVISRIEDAMYLQVNDTFCTRTGYSREEAIGKTAFELNLFVDTDDMERLREALVKKGRVDGHEIRFRRRDGAIGSTLVSAKKIVFHGQDCMLAISKNITELKQHQLALQKSEKRFRAIFENAQDAIYLKDLFHRYTLVNPNMETLFGRSTDEFIGKTDEAIFGTSEGNKTKITDTEALSDKIIKIDENRTIKGRPRIFHTIKIPLKDATGEVTGLCGFSRDVTEIRELHSQLLQAQKMEAIGNLAGGIAHDFNNMLFPLVGYTELLQDEIPNDGPSQEYIDEIIRATTRARALVKQILTFSRQEDHEVMPIKIEPVISEAVSLLHATIPASIDIQKYLDPDCGTVFADPTQVHQIVINLATNAYHAMEDGSGILRIGLKQVRLEAERHTFIDLPPGEYAQLSVSDTGTGIDKSIIDRIFEPYFTTKDKSKGTGLGLSVVQGIVKNYKGDIHIYSEPGKGTQIHVYLPIVESRKNRAESQAAAAVSGGTERILIIDDEVAIAKMEQKILEKLGYAAASYTDSLAALEAFKAAAETFDLVITDMTMPNLTGLQLSQEIRHLRPDIPIIICTGFSDNLNEEKCKALGIQGFVMKPLIRSKFTQLIRNVLDA